MFDLSGATINYYVILYWSINCLINKESSKQEIQGASQSPRSKEAEPVNILCFLVD